LCPNGKLPYQLAPFATFLPEPENSPESPFKYIPINCAMLAAIMNASQGHDTRAIQDYLGHKNIHHTIRYTQMSPQRFENFWRD
jgi:hypothetical protein